MVYHIYEHIVQRREHRKREMVLTEELEGVINYLNQFLPPDQQIQYYHKDMARINKRYEPVQ